MKDNKILKLTGTVMFVSVLAVILVSSTYAKYTSSASGSDTATVAKWAIKLNNEDITQVESVNFGLFDTIYDTDGENVEGNVAEGKIAPGTSGKFNLELENDSEVTAEYTINFTLTGAEGLPLEFSLDGQTWGDLNNVTAQTLAMDDAETTEVDEGKATVTVQWRWAYERTDKDAEDTGFGIDASDVEVEAELVVSQKD